MQLPDFLQTDSGGYIHLTGHRIGLVDLIDFYRDGDSAEMLSVRFPSVPLALVHKVLAFYLENQAEVDAYVDADIAECERQRAEAKPCGPSLEELRRRRAAQRLAPGA